jgi:hypothetical protein
MIMTLDIKNTAKGAFASKAMKKLGKALAIGATLLAGAGPGSAFIDLPSMGVSEEPNEKKPMGKREYQAIKAKRSKSAAPQ